MKQLILALLFCASAYGIADAEFDPHRFQVKTYNEWAKEILDRFPFKDGVLTHRQYQIFSAAYEKSMVDFYQSVTDRKIKEAQETGRTGVVMNLQKRLDDQKNQIKTYVQAAEKGIFQSLDPQNSDLVTINEAKRKLVLIARAADMNRNGVLEPIEIDIAEAILIRGIDINDPNALHVLLNDLDRRDAWSPE